MKFDFLTFCSWIFTGCFVAMIGVGLCGIGWLITEGFVLCVRLFKPNFLATEHEEESHEDVKKDRAEVRILAIDVLMARRREVEKRQRDAVKKQYAELNNMTQVESETIDIPEEVQTARHRTPPEKFVGVKPGERLYWLMQPADGRYCVEILRPQGNAIRGSRFAFATLPSRFRKRFTEYEANVWIRHLGGHVKAVPANVAARQLEKVAAAR